jgi:hypothetical protein
MNASAGAKELEAKTKGHKNETSELLVELVQVLRENRRRAWCQSRAVVIVTCQYKQAGVRP